MNNITEQKSKLPENRPDKESYIDSDNEASPFKIYEDKYCSKCQDYRGCIGLLDFTAAQMQNPENLKKLPEDMAGMFSAATVFSGLGTSQRSGLIIACIRARDHIEEQATKQRNKKQNKTHKSK